MRLRITAINKTEIRAYKHLLKMLVEHNLIAEDVYKKDYDVTICHDVILKPLEVLKTSMKKSAKREMDNTEKFIMELYDHPNNLNFQQIADRLNQFDYKTSTGKRFQRTTVKRIIDKQKRNISNKM